MTNKMTGHKYKLDMILVMHLIHMRLGAQEKAM